jgi:hypothetical protein
MLYHVALGTGFRAEEPRTLLPERFKLNANPPTITALACYTKNGDEAVQPIAAALAEALKPRLARKGPGKPVFEGMSYHTAKMLRADLRAALDHASARGGAGGVLLRHEQALGRRQIRCPVAGRRQGR